MQSLGIQQDALSQTTRASGRSVENRLEENSVDIRADLTTLPTMEESDRPTGETQDIQFIGSAGVLRILAQADRLEMLALLTDQAQTATEVGRALGVAPNRASYHLRQLRDAGLVQEVGTGRKRWKEERYYLAAARHFIVDPALTCDAETATSLQRKIQATFFDWRRREVLGIDLASLARQVVHERLRIQPGQTILIMFGPDGFELAETLAVEIQAVGAVPRPKFWSRNTAFSIADRFDSDALSAQDFLPAAEMDALDAVVFLSASVSQGGPPNESQRAKLPLLLESVSRWHRDLRERRIPYLEIAFAHRGEFEHGPMSVEEAVDVYWRCVAFDPTELLRRATALAEALGTDRSLRLTCSRGTELSMRFDHGSIYPSDGVITEEDRKAGRSFDEVPTGTVSVIPEPDSVHGTFVADWALVVGQRIEEPRVTLKSGRIVEIAGKNDVGFLRERIEASAGDPDLISEVRFGLNTAGRGPTGKPPLDACLDGAVTLGFGNNELIGGNVRSTMGLFLPSLRATVQLGDRLIVKDGRSQV